MGLNKEQLQAVNSTSDRVLCLAGAGSGKTATMIARISHLVDTGVDPNSILVLTFTNAAAGEMRSRYETKHPNEEIPEFKTFHAFCYSLLCKNPDIRSALGYTTIPNISSEEQAKSIEERARVQCDITLSKEKLERRSNLSRDEERQAALYDKAVNRLMLMENIITFDMLNIKVSELFVKDHPATRPYKKQYKYIHLDEMQDTDKVQMDFLNSFTHSDFYFTGDTLQNLYSWRGTSNIFIKMLAASDGWEKIKLFTNYRSTNQICEYANKFSAKYADPSYRIEMKGTRDGDKVHNRFIAPLKGRTIVGSDCLDNILKELSIHTSTSAIICRTNREVNAVAAYLKEHNIEFNSGKSDKYQNLIDCAISDTYAIGWLSSYLSSSKYGEYIRLSSQAENPDLAWFLKIYGSNSQIKDDMQIIQGLRDIANSTKLTNIKLRQTTELLQCQVLPETDQYYVGKDYLKYLKNIISDKTNSNVYVGTIHSVKGLEYDTVFVINVGSYNFQLDCEEEKNLFYVAVTRAKEHLFVYQVFSS